ncbi:MAG: CDP-6-deoxy-delta-3,4-glucoseen reductase [Pseudomonadales bacterium]|nr:CDP-6-deoxy-delta-3,4-glucoseen reductase [Pseudomonadales bacterium]MEC8813306.1 2Fe-2S iron-sulfur cluster-binding protein [Pseudomonadota bacterium]HAG97116.1 CDP-6-deoxy-delta-3,4-glucoseen reductase [Gammaproteobacteria bacterium]MAQ23547.1 CDP-6-deoxy-delta-3,4-glucoseen reductase [Pseudomonadales bacterium]MBI27369.1 CDP-6-deoxy-delta-3,4-glucoseen reductase [Pseudomonadales bacterium]|tara:strand:- start:1825 stop:2844 length:1020 start_codon:yes stop_codon:yes gene_type:complete
MTHQITFLPSRLTLQAQACETVLQAATRQGFRVPRACDAGVCLLCKGRLMAGKARHKHGNITLDASDGPVEPVFCCLIYPISDLQVEIEHVLAPGQLPSQEVTAKIQSIEQATPDVKIVQLLLPAGKKIDFHPGQYLQIIIDPETVAAFSIANAPREDRTIELHIREAPDSDSYALLAKRLQEGELLQLSLPHGETTLHKLQDDKKLIFIAASTGFSQIRSLLEGMVAAGDERPVTIYWGARTARDLYRHDDMKAYAFLHPQFKYIPVVSDQPEWPARKGLVHEAVLKDLQADFSHCTIVCGGSPAMVYATLDDFVAAGMQPEQMISDVFDYAPRDPKM